MPGVAPSVLVEVKNALRQSHAGVVELTDLLQPLGRSFDDIGSIYEPLGSNISKIVNKAYKEGWLADLVRAAAAERPKIEALGRLRDLLEKMEPPPPPGKSVIDRPSLVCGRAPQWNTICQFAPTHRHQVMLVPGARGQETMHFRDRVQTHLTSEPSRVITAVHWPTLPQSLEEMIDALAVALETGVDGLQQTLREHMAHTNLVLLHPCIFEGFTQSHFVDYYTKWLPAALSQRTVGVLKCIQPIEWPLTGGGGGLFARLLARSGGSHDGREGALELITALRSNHAPNMRILGVDELSNLETRELEQFLELSDFSEKDQRALLSELLEAPHIPRYVFKTIDDYWTTIGGSQ